MVKVWLCRNGIIANSCGPVPLIEFTLGECESKLEIEQTHRLCVISQGGQQEICSYKRSHQIEFPFDLGRPIFKTLSMLG
jgi:hypothetical protein